MITSSLPNLITSFSSSTVIFPSFLCFKDPCDNITGHRQFRSSHLQMRRRSFLLQGVLPCNTQSPGRGPGFPRRPLLSLTHHHIGFAVSSGFRVPGSSPPFPIQFLFIPSPLFLLSSFPPSLWSVSPEVYPRSGQAPRVQDDHDTDCTCLSQKYKGEFQEGAVIHATVTHCSQRSRLTGHLGSGLLG